MNGVKMKELPDDYIEAFNKTLKEAKDKISKKQKNENKEKNEQKENGQR